MEMHTKEEKKWNVLIGHEEIILCVCVISFLSKMLFLLQDSRNMQYPKNRSPLLGFSCLPPKRSHLELRRCPGGSARNKHPWALCALLWSFLSSRLTFQLWSDLADGLLLLSDFLMELSYLFVWFTIWKGKHQTWPSG